MKEKKYLIYGVCLVLILLVGLTYAYFSIIILGEKKKVTVNTTDLRIVFDNGDDIEGINIEPGWSITKTFSVENKTSNEYKYNLVFKDLINTFVTKGYLVYKITSTNNGYNMSDYKDIPKSNTLKNKVIEYSVPISSNTKQEYTIEIKYISDDNVDQGDDMGKELSAYLYIEEGTENMYAGYEEGTLGYQIMKDNPTRKTRSNNNNGTNDFATPFNETTSGTLFTSTESIAGITSTPQEVYYYAGNTTNNWVKFGKYENDWYYCNKGGRNITHSTSQLEGYDCEKIASKNDDIYWRIIRTNHDESVRLLYSGTSTDTTIGYIGTNYYNVNDGSPEKFGYKYGSSDDKLDDIRMNTTDSVIKTTIDSWYQNNLTNYKKYLSTCAVYCNDRNLGNEQTYNNLDSDFNFVAYDRLDEENNGVSATPTYNCSDIRDGFSVENTNAKLDYPIALMTADEIAFAGGVVFQKMSTPYAWFTSNSVGTSITGDFSNLWWTLTPLNFKDNYISMYTWRPSDAEIYYNWINSKLKIRPAISLKSCTLYGTGNGTAENPYTILETESGC